MYILTTDEEIQDSLEFCKELEKVIGKPLSSIDTPDDVDSIVSYPVPEVKVEPKPIPKPIPRPAKVIDKQEPVAKPIPRQPKKYEPEVLDTKVVSEEEPSFVKEVIKGIISVLVCVVIAFLVAFLVTHFVVHHTVVEGTSMEGALQDKDVLLIEKVSYYFHEPERYDIITFPYNEDVYYIKRIIGLPGETIQIIDGYVYINGQKLDEHYDSETIQDAGLAKDEIKLGKDEYFVLGDNRNASIDSRKEEVGVVKRKNISGKAWLRIYPFGTFGFIKHE